jgi:hypothetical protein
LEALFQVHAVAPAGPTGEQVDYHGASGEVTGKTINGMRKART